MLFRSVVLAAALLQVGFAVVLNSGDVFTGMFELGGLTDDNYFVLRAHSPVQGAFSWITGIGHAPGWMTHCTPPSSCAGGPLVRPIFGTLNVSGVGECTGVSGGCTGPPDIQPSTGCNAYGCWNEACGCQIGNGDSGCWGRDMRNTIALIQRGDSVGETGPVQGGCTFSRKIHFAEMAGARAAIIFNNVNYAAVYMAADDTYTNLTIPAIFLTKDAGLLLWHMIQEAELRGGVDVSLTNNTEDSMRLVVDSIEGRDNGGSWVTGDVEFRLEEPGIEAEVLEGLNVTNNEVYPYGSFRVQGSYLNNALSLRPVCLDGGAACEADQVLWNRVPALLEHGLDRILPFGLELSVRAPGDDGEAFEHVRGHVVGADGAADETAHVKLRWVPSCQPEMSYVVDCMDTPGRDGEECLSALDERGYRNFNDLAEPGRAPLLWYCDSKYCEGDYITKQTLKRLEVRSVPPLPPPCPDGQKHGYVYLGPDDWGKDESLHLCGHGDRTRQAHVCRTLPAGWYFNTSCALHDSARECGHSGWFMEGGFIASCTDSADCAVDNSRSRLDLHVNLATDGQVAFTYTAHGEQYFDYMTFEINDRTMHHTQTWWSTGSSISLVVAKLPAGAHKLSWAWVKDWSLSGGDDKATLHEILVTGTPDDASCSDCPAGFCGNGGLRGCVVCPRGMKSASAASTQCEPCGQSPDGTLFTGPADWPLSGNTDTCEWGCTKGFCSMAGGSPCSSTTTCPANQCCPHRGECFMPTLEQVEDGEWPLTMEMLRNCVELTPFDKQVADTTQSILRGFLDVRGVYPWYNRMIPGGSDTKGRAITTALNDILAKANDPGSTAIDDQTLLPRESDFHGLHGKLVKTMRDMLDADLAYVPPTFYQDVSFFLPWKLHVRHRPGCKGYADQCAEIHILSQNSMLESMGRVKHSEPCDCLTCSCSMKLARSEQYVGYKVTQLDIDGRGLADAASVLETWANEHATGDDAGARMMFALSSGEKVPGRVQTSMRDSAAGQFGCSFATRNLGVCGQLPTCDNNFCHVRMVLESATGDKETLDVPWTVVYHPEGVGSFDTAGEIDCTAVTGPPFVRNVECMAAAVTHRYRYGDAKAFSGQEAPVCHDGRLRRGGVEGRWFPVYAPAPSFQLVRNYKQCHGDTTRLLFDGMHALGSPERAAAGMVMFDEASQTRTGVLALRSFAREELAMHNVFSEIAATKPDALLIDLRGNVGGDLCHVFELAYLVSSAFSSVQEAQQMLALHLRHSEALDASIYTDIVLGQTRGSTAGWGDACSLELKDGKYKCKTRGPDLTWYYCGQSPLCGRGMECPACPEVTSDGVGEWSLPFRPRCSSRNTLLRFDPLSQCSTKESGFNVLQTKKICPHCDGPDCAAQGKCGYDKLGLHILTDGRCIGACATFVQLMQAADLATVVGPMAGKSVAPYLSTGALSNTAKNWWCSMEENEGSEAATNPNLQLIDKALPMLGQDLMFPLAAVKFASGESDTPKMREFPVSERAHHCQTELYQEALATASVCGINSDEDLELMRKNKGVQNCTLPDAAVAHRVCNKTCSRPDVLCVQSAEHSAAEAAKCQPKCWSLCSAVECDAGAKRIWDGVRFLCWAVREETTTFGNEFRLGQAVGKNQAWDEAHGKYSWRAKLSAGGATVLILSLMVLAAVLGRLSHGLGEGVALPTLDGGAFNEGSPAVEKMKEGLGKAGTAVAAAGAVLIALPVAAYHAVASRLQQYGGASGGISDTVHLPASTEASGAGGGQESSDYHAL